MFITLISPYLILYDFHYIATIWRRGHTPPQKMPDALRQYALRAFMPKTHSIATTSSFPRGRIAGEKLWPYKAASIQMRREAWDDLSFESGIDEY